MSFVEITLIHWIYLIFIFLILGFMISRLDTTIICIVGIFLIAFVANGSLQESIISIFSSFLYAISELLPTILIISLIVAMSKTLSQTGVNDQMVAPFTRLLKNPTLAYWVIGFLMLGISLFFWPSPGVALIGAVLLPVAIRAGLPAIGVAISMNLFGHGIALSGDFVIQAAPKLTADAAGIPVGDVVSASIPLVIVMGLVTTVIAFILLKRDMKKGKLNQVKGFAGPVEEIEKVNVLTKKQKKFFAILIPILFALNIVTMITFKLQGGQATALVGGTAVIIFLLINLFGFKMEGLKKTTSRIVEGFQFAFRVFGPVIPIAAFFYLGDSGFFTIIGEGVLPEDSNGIVNDLGAALANIVPLSAGVGAITLTVVGAITGLDGSGFSGISLAGSVAALFAAAIGDGISVLTALGQIAGIWIGGGTLIPWALIPAAAICNVDPFELARRNLIPVICGLVVTTIFAIVLI